MKGFDIIDKILRNGVLEIGICLFLGKLDWMEVILVLAYIFKKYTLYNQRVLCNFIIFFISKLGFNYNVFISLSYFLILDDFGELKYRSFSEKYILFKILLMLKVYQSNIVYDNLITSVYIILMLINFKHYLNKNIFNFILVFSQGYFLIMSGIYKYFIEDFLKIYKKAIVILFIFILYGYFYKKFKKSLDIIIFRKSYHFLAFIIFTILIHGYNFDLIIRLFYLFLNIFFFIEGFRCNNYGDFYNFNGFFLNNLDNKDNKNMILSHIYLFISSLIMVLYKNLIFGTLVSITIGDSFAAIIGKKYGKFILINNKSLQGFAAFLISSFITLFILSNFFYIYTLDYILVIILGIFELLTFQNDNLVFSIVSLFVIHNIIFN